MPSIHLGVYLTSGKETYNAVKWALEVVLPRDIKVHIINSRVAGLGWIQGVRHWCKDSPMLLMVI